MTRRCASRDGERGQALLEFALVVPILVIFVMAIFQFAYVLETQNGLTNAVREAARRVASTTSTNPNWTTLRTWTLEQLTGTVSPPVNGLLKTNVSGYDGNRLWPSPYPGLTPANTTTPAITFCSYSVSSVTNYRVKIEVRYKHPVFFGPLSFATDAVDGTANGFWDLTASAQMRLESVSASEVTAAGNDPGACT